MKKFAKILGFLGFFVTLGMVSIGTVYAHGYCWMNDYYGLGRTEDDCNKCAEDFSNYPYSMSNYNFSGDLCYKTCSTSCTDVNYRFQNGGTYGIPSGSTVFIYNFGDTTHNSLVNVSGLTCSNIENYCAEVFDCGKNTTCSANWKTINFVDHNNNPLGTLYIGFNTVWSTQKTTECADCLNNPSQPLNYAVFYPVFQTPTAPSREGYTFLGYSSSPTGNIIIGPDHINMYGKLNYNNATSVSAISGNTITLYARYENAGCAQNYWYNSQTDECIPCDEGFTSPGGYGNQHTCTKSCSEMCTQRHNGTDECAEGVTGFYSPIVPITGTEYQDDQGHCYDTNNIEILAPDNDLTETHWCRWNCDGCKDEQCYNFVGGACEPKVWNAMYDCDEGTNVITDTNQPESYGNYIIADFSCQGQNGQTFIGWTLGSGGIVYNHNDPEHDELTWGCADQTFKPVFEDTCYEVSFNDERNGGHPSGYPASTPGTHGPFYKKYNDPNHIWYSDNECSEESKLEIGSGVNQVNVIGHLPWKEHATFTGYYDETQNPDLKIFAGDNDTPQGVLTNDGASWTITGDTVLYAQYTCVDGYAPNANGDCVGDKIDVKYTCVSPIESEAYTRTFNDDATYGTAYLVKSVGTGNHEVPCAFTGYELNNNYVWNLQNYSGNSNNPNGEYGPGDTLSSADWQYITTTPLTEIEFVLDKSLWHLKTYTVEYRCGDIKPDADVYTDSSATYGQTYSVAGQFDPFNGGNVTVQDFLDNNCKPNGGFGAWTFQNWTFTCAGADSGPYNTNDPTFGTWTYDSNNCYFTANWAQTDFVIHLESNIADGNPNSANSTPTDLYTRYREGVYLDSGREQEMTPSEHPIEIPKKEYTLTINGGSAGGQSGTFTWNNQTVTSATPSVGLTFTGFYDTDANITTPYINPDGFITDAGRDTGIMYNDPNVSYTWDAHWNAGNDSNITLPTPTINTTGYDFGGWICYDSEDDEIYNTTGNPNQSLTVNVNQNITCTAQWSVACRSVSFDENGGISTGGGNNGKFWKISGQIGWYADSTCTSNATPNVENTRPTKEHATFIGYDDTDLTPAVRIFNNLGAITTGGENWTITQNATLYAQYECDDLYYLNTQTGNCEMCPAGSFYDSDTGSCKTCNEILQPLTGISGWTSRPPYNWSIKQCYRVCDGANDTQTTCNVVDTVSNHNEMEQFLTGNLINGNTGKQISFYGNEFATDPNNRVNTCDANVGAINCPQGFLAGGASGANKLMAAAVDFYEDRDLDGTYEPNGKRYIVGGRIVTDDGYKLNDGFAWSQVVGDAQISDGEPIISIIYPATLAPTVADPEHHTFSNYGYPESNPSQNLFVDSNYSLTSGSDGNAEEIIDFANDNNYSNMSPIIGDSNYTRNLYAQYTAANSYTLTYLCNSGETPSTDHQVTGLYVGTQFNLITPDWCTGCYGFTGWWDGLQIINPEQFTNFTWNYNSNMTFVAQCDESTDKFIIYNKIPVSNVNASGITGNGNTYVPANGGTPTTFTCGDGITPIAGQPQLKNSDDIVIGEVVKWCKDSDLEDCDLPLELQNSNCNNKNVYAKWECNAEAGYRLNDTGDDCVTCPAGSYLNNGNCEACPEGWTSNPPYNWTRNQCYKLCDGNNDTVNRSCNAEIPTTPGFYWSALFLNQDGTNHQITFYGNDINGTDVCKMEEITYCPAVLISFSAAGSYVNKTKASQITFMRQGNEAEAGKRYIVGFLDANGYYVSTNNSKFWSHIAGPGQQVTEGEDTYTRIIYPTDVAPSPDSTPNPAFKGYFDGTGSNATPRVAAELGLDSSNAVAFPQSQLLLNQIGDRTLYPQYCENGQEWNGSVCTGTDYTVKYICGAHGANVESMSMENTATYGQSYKVAYSGAQKIAECNPNTGYVLKTNDNNKPVWKFNGNDTEYFTGEEFQWISTISGPTFTAQYDCAAGYTANGDVNNGGNCVLGVFTVTYNCGDGQPVDDYTDTVTVALNGTYTVLANGAVPNGQGGFVTCNLSGQGFNGWKFSGNGQTYTGGNTIVWSGSYSNETMTATYRPCTANEVLVDGVCYSTCSVSCVIPSGLQSNGCPVHDPVYPNPNNPNDPDGVRCEYVSQTIGGYDNGDGNCRYISSEDDHEQGEIIPRLGDCRYNVTCNNTSLEWNSDPNVWACVWPSGTLWTVTFKCDVNDSVTTYNVTVPGTIPSVPAASTCEQTGSSFTNWKDADHGGDLLAAGATNVSWTHEYNATYTPDRTNNQYMMTLDAHGGTHNGSDPVTKLLEVFGQDFYKNANMSLPIEYFTTDQLPTNGTQHFAGYMTDGGESRTMYNPISGNWGLVQPNIAANETWYAKWSDCNPGQYYSNGQCNDCPSSHPNSDPTTATSMNDCYYNCVTCTQYCPYDEEGVYDCYDYSSAGLPQNGHANYPGNTCVANPGQEQNCNYNVSCESGYHPSEDQKHCIGDTYTITLNSHRETSGYGQYYGNDSSPANLLARHGENGGVWYDANNQMVVGDALTSNPSKYANVTLNGNGGEIEWGGSWTSYNVSTTATFGFQGFFRNQTEADNPYINNYGKLTTDGESAARTYIGNQTWHAQWTPACITLPNARRTGYNFTGWVYGSGVGGSWAGNAGDTICSNNGMPQTADITITATWDSGASYSITYDDNTRQLHLGLNANSICSPNSYQYGQGAQITCDLSSYGSSGHAVFKGWCPDGTTNNCYDTTPTYYTIPNNATVNYTFYAHWECEIGYNLENGVCVPNASELCPAQLPTNANLNMSYPLNPTPNAGTCTYHLQCASCIGSNDHDCYTRDGMNSDGTFIVTGPVGNSTVLNNVRCEPATYTAVYRCGDGTPTIPYYDTDHIITYNGSYTVLPNGTENGGVVTCSKDGEMFHHWTFNLESGHQYNDGDQINPWRYHGTTVPTFTAQYGQCPEGEVLVDGDCKPMCTKNCIYPGANPGACPSNYPTNAICAYDPSSNPVIGYRPSLYSNKCLDVDYPHDPVVANQCDVTEVTCPTHYEWNPVTLKCDPKIYQVRLDANGGTTSFGFVSKLFEKYNEGWGKNETGSFIPNLQLSSSELPTGADISQIFTGYGINCNSTARMISADGTVLASPTTLVDNDQTWYACYGPNTSATFKVRFKCNANEPDVIPVQEVHVGESIVAPATRLCPGVAFNQWKGTLIQPVIMLNAGTSTTWNNYSDEVFVPDAKAVYRVDLNENGGTFPADDYQELWYAVDMGWYKNAGLTTQITYIPGNSLPTKPGSNFNGWLDSTTQAQRGNFSGANWVLPTNGISTDEIWDAQWGPCAAGQYWDNGICLSCSEATGGIYPLADANATNVNQCYKICSICLRNGCPTVHGANCVYNPDDPSVQNNGKEYNNGTQTCVSNINPTPNCPYMITDCDLGWVPAPDGQSCVEDEKHTITLESHIIHGASSDPDVLYTWHNRGVYLYSNYTGEMTTTQNPLSENPLNYAIVTFNLNGQGASLIWNGQTYTGTMNANVLFDYQGFWKSVNGSPRYIDVDGHINGSGIAAGTGYTDDATWHARWQSRTLGTISSSGNDLPVPRRPGFVFDGWYDLSMGGNQVDSSSLVNNDMTVYAHWSDVIYTVNLVSDRNNCQPSSNTPTKLFEKYNVGWNRDTTGRFDRDLLLNDDELPIPNAGYEFKGYYDALSGGDRVIRPDGRVEQEPNYTDNNHTWYARCGRPTGPFTVTFKCDTDGHNVQSNSMNYGANVTAPTVADANCTKPGHTFNKWKSMVNNENIVFNAGETYSWGYYSGADFVPQWVLDAPYHVTLDQNGATQPGVTNLYEKYGMWWSQYQSGNPAISQLSGNALPRKTGSNFRGYQNESGDWMGTYNSTTGVWGLPSNTTVTSDETWTAQWDNCVDGEYWLNGICESCSKQTNGEYTHSDPGATSPTQCYKECTWYCTENGCPGTQPTGMSSCTYGNVSGNGIQYNVPGATCQLQGQPNFPQNSCQACTDCCPMNITCDKGYDLVGCVCRDNRYTITLDSDLYNDNGTPANPSTLHTWFNHGVYRDYNRTLMMTPDENPLASGTPSTFATVTLNGNGAYFNWHNQYGPQLQDNVDFVFDGFYDTTGAAIDPVIGIDRHITEAGQSIGTTAQNNQTWRASWRNGSVDLPSISRDGYTFDGWWTECDGGTRVSMGNQTITVSGDRTLCAHWSGKSYTVTYNCDNEGGQGGTATDSQLAYQNTSYTVRENFIPCSKPATETTRAHEFENWKFNLNSNTYWPGDPIMWIFTVDNPTFDAHYKECPNGWYFDGSCKQCPSGYTNSDIDADSASKCYKTCDVQCTRPTSQCPMNEEGVLTCTYPNNTYPLGKQYSGSDDCIYDGTAPACEPFTIMCKPGYTPDYYLSTDTGTHCTKLADHEITLNQNGGTGGQDKIYTIYDTGVYRDAGRNYSMTQYPLLDLPSKSVNVTFNSCDNNDPNCENATVWERPVDLEFKGYYQTTLNNSQYIYATGLITSTGLAEGKSYTDNNKTWYAQWDSGTVDSDKWPLPPTHQNACATYSFYGWWTAVNGGNVVSPDTPVSENVTWYAHWCESCPTGTIDHGSCTPQNCKATFTCDNGYAWDETQCQCVAATGLTLTYQPNGGTPDEIYTENRYFGETFTTRDGNTYTKVGHIIAKWANVGVGGGSFPLLAQSYPYNYNGNTTLEPEWKQCTCTFNGNSGVESCDANIVTNNTCTPDVECKPGYVNGHYTCINEHLETCSAQCDICPAGTFQNDNQCSPCTGNNVSAAGATQCEPCDPGYTANTGHTQCVGNPITIDWDENGGRLVDNGICQFCTNGCDGITCESCGAHPDNMLTLANVTHSNSAMQFLGWKLFRGDSNYPAGTNVMCTYDNVGVYSGTSTKIQAQWNECQCSDQLNPHVVCQPVIVDDVCRHVYWCDSVGYNIVGDDYSNTSPYCDPKPFDVTYNCGVGATGTPLISADTATYDDTYIVKNAGGVNCQKVGFNFVGWLFDGDNYLHQADDRITWTYTSNKTFTAQYSQCAAGEVWVNGACEPCTCPQENWGAGVTQCVASPSSTSTCSALVSCNSGYYHPQGNCNGATCSAQCDQIQSNAIYVCGDGATGPAPATETMNYGATHTVKGQTSCAKSGYTFNGWNFTGTNRNYNPGATVQWNYGTDQTFTGNWCENCGDVTNGSCSLDATNAGQCSYTTSCYDGYVLVSGAGTAHPVCEPDSSLKITYRPNGGVNPQTGNNQPVLQPVTYWANFTTLMGTTFTMGNHILTRWDLVGDDTSTFDKHQDPDTNQYYAKLNEYYDHYNTLGDTVLDAHWEQCTCDADNCTTYATDENKCACSGTCPTGYTYGGCNCNGTDCAPICNKKQSDAIYVCGEGTTGQAPAAQTMNYGDTHTVKDKGNCSKTNHTFMKWAFTGDGDYHNPGDTVAWYYTEDKTFTGQWCENCSDVANGSCELGTVFAGSCQYTCSCEPGYKLVGDCNARPVCKPDNTLAIHYKSNNGANQTYDQSVTYGQSFMTEGGTRFTKTNHIMTHWNVESGPSNTFTNGSATLSGNYVYNDTDDTTLSAQWAQCTCDADNCTTYATDSNTCACNASEESCPDGYIYGGCECNGTNCAPICTLSQSNAIYNCGTGTGIPPVSELVSYGTPYTIKANATVYGCSRENSTFAGWEFDGDQQIHAAGDTVTWNYTTDKNFRAVYCNECLTGDHCTLDIPNPGECVVTCHTGYEWDANLKKCVAKTYENGITYKPNGGTPNQNYTQSVTYDAPFTTLDWNTEHYTKAHHILTRWDVESGGAGTFNGGYAALGTEYTYHTDGATSLLAKWIECGINEISLDNRCQQCRCTDNNAGVTSCETSATNNDTCSCSGECAAGYINAGCNCNGTNCTQSCEKCKDNQVSVNNVCEKCVCEKNIDGIEGIISGCGFVSNNGNTCNWDPTTCRLGYGYPDLTCTETEHNNNCTASCTICEAGYYGPNGRECLPCPDGYTSLPGATSIRECFISGCPEGQHIEHGNCVADERACSIPNATSAARIWNPAIGTYGPCTVIECDAANGYHESGNACVRDTCVVAHGSAESEYNGGQWECFVTKCDPGYEPSSDYKSCVECANRYVDGDVAVSSYVSECEIAACMYQGQKYTLEGNECVPICTADRFTREDPSNPTGTIQWDERTKKCIRTCKPGYKMW